MQGFTVSHASLWHRKRKVPWCFRSSEQDGFHAWVVRETGACVISLTTEHAAHLIVLEVLFYPEPVCVRSNHMAAVSAYICVGLRAVSTV